MSLHPRLTLSLARHLLSTGRITRQELVIYCHSLAIAGEKIWGLNAFSKLYSRRECLEQLSSTSDDGQSLAGIPISIKANIAVKDSPLTASSNMLLPFQNTNCGYDADVVQRFRQHGATIIGITQMDEFGMGSLGTNVSQGVPIFTKNPIPFLTLTNRTIDEWVHEIQKPSDLILEEHYKSFTAPTSEEDILLAGGSSCGSAASVSHGSSLISVASDTGGSIRLPAAWCGVTGFKPAYGTISRKGLVSYASSLDTIGLLAPTSSCISDVLPKLIPYEDSIITDSTARCHQTNNLGGSTVLQDELDFKNLRVGIPSAFVIKECPPSIREKWEQTAKLLENHSGTLLSTIDNDILSPEIIRVSLAAYYILASGEASSNLSRYNGFTIGAESKYTFSTSNYVNELEKSFAASRTGFGTEVIRRILSGTFVLSSDRFHSHYEAALKVRAILHQQLQQALEISDVLLIPTCLSLPHKRKMDDRIDPTAMFTNDILTVPISLAGLPAISIPSSKNSFIGLQIVGTSNKTVLQVAKLLQQQTLL